MNKQRLIERVKAMDTHSDWSMFGNVKVRDVIAGVGFCSILSTTGCQLLGTSIDTHAGKLANQYCEESDPIVRELVSQRINQAIHPHTVSLVCNNPAPIPEPNEETNEEIN